MTKATEKFNPKLLLFFDFDGTLASDTLDFVLKESGEDPEEFRKKHIDKLVDNGWEILLSVFYSLIKNSKQLGLNKARFKELGEKLEPYDEVEEMFSLVRKKAEDILPEVEVEFYLISSGLIDIQRHCSIARQFTNMWGSEFAFDENENPEFVKNLIIHPEKKRYILQQAKGLGAKGPNAPSDVFKYIPPDDWYCPLDQAVYVGDGLSDMPAFELMEEYNGYSLGVVHAEDMKEWKGYKKVHESRRVMNLVKADYRENSELMRSLILSVESITKEMALHKLSVGE